MPTIHAIHGYICSGKTTFAKKLEKDENVIRFTLDEWINDQCGKNTTDQTDQNCMDHARDEMTKQWKSTLNKGIDIILDDGFWRVTDRNSIRRYADSNGAEFKLYKVTCSFEEMSKRLAARNQSKTNDSCIISESQFWANTWYFQSLLPDEKCIIIDTST